MRKLLLTLAFFFGAFILSTIMAKGAQALTYHSSIWDNTTGIAPITVSYYITQFVNGQRVRVTFSDNTQLKSIYLAAGAWANDQPTQSAYNPPYQLTWQTICSDPTIRPVATSDLQGSNWVLAYARQFVQCPLPSNLSATCSSDTLFFSWSAGPSATQYAIRIDDVADGWIGGLDTVNDNVFSTSYSRAGAAGHSYSWWVHGINQYGWSYSVGGPGFGCAAPPPPPAPTLPAISNLRIGNVPTSCITTNTYGGSQSYGNPIGNFPWNNTNVATGIDVANFTNAEFELFVNGAKAGSTLTWTYFSLQTRTIGTWSWNLSVDNTYTWHVRAGNSAGWTGWVNGPSWFVAKCPPPPDVSVSFSALKDSGNNFRTTFLPGETIFADVTVNNNSTVTVSNFWTKIYRTTLNTTCSNTTQSDQFFISSLQGLNPSLNSDPSALTRTVSFTAPTAVSSYTAYAFVDATCVLAESNETNNTASTPYSVSTNALADLIIQSASFVCPSSGTTACQPEELANVSLTIKNQGGSDASNFTFDAFATTLDATCSNSTSSFRSQFTTLAAGGTLVPAQAGATFNVPSAPGNYTAYFFVDSTCNVAEGSFENNNTNSAAYSVAGFDLSASFVPGSWNKQVFQAGEGASATVRVTNSSLAALTSIPTTLGVWPKSAAEGSGEPVVPTCPTAGSSPLAGPSYNYNVPDLAPGVSLNIPISFNVGNTPGNFTANAYVIPLCDIDLDQDWSNNSTSAPTNVSFTYTVDVDAWFETVNGDVCSNGNVALSIAPPAGRWQSSYLLARSGTDTKAKSQLWTLNNYPGPCVNTPVYDYMAERFKQKAKDIGTCSSCSLSASRDGLNYKNGNHTINGSPPSTNSNTVWFVDGDLLILLNVTLSDPADTLIFIVSGNIIVNTSVTRMDGIYIAGGTFRDTASDSSLLGNQLLINGAVYGRDVLLNRKLSSTATCIGGVTPCNNTAEPAEKIVWDPKYLVGLNSLLASPAVTWKEVEP